MIRAGLAGAGLGIIYVMSLTLLSPFCTLCLTPLLGTAVGYLAGWFDKPLRVETGITRGIGAGLIAGLGVIVGQMLAAIVNAVLVTNSEQLPDLMQQLGLSQFMIADSIEYWQTTMLINSFCSVFNLMLVVGLSAAGSLFWFQRHNKNSLSTISS